MNIVTPEDLKKYEPVATVIELRGLRSLSNRMTKLEDNRLVVEHREGKVALAELVEDLDARLVKHEELMVEKREKAAKAAADGDASVEKTVPSKSSKKAAKKSAKKKAASKKR